MAAARICLRDRPGSPDAPARPGILAAILERAVPGLEGPPRGRHDTPIGRLLGQAMEQAGIRASQRARRVGDYTLERVIGEGPGYQDWQAKHVTLDHIRRVRLYHVRGESSRDDRERIRRAAEREFQILETLQHPGVLRVFGFTEHELGPALIFERDPLEIRLDHFLAQNRERLTLDTRLDLMRQIAEVVRFAHEKKVVHRGLAPQSILVRLDKDPQAHPRIKVFNWQLGFRAGSDTTGVTRSIAPTSHVDRLVDDSSQVYLAPEAIHDDGQLGEHLDVFSLGALAYHLFSGEPPAATAVELDEKLRDTVGLQISAVMNGAGVQLQDLVKDATRPDVASRTGTVDDFLAGLDKVEDELTSPDHKYVTEPLQAQRGDLLPGHFTVVRRLGQGACSGGLLVARDGQEFVLKVASGTEQNERVREDSSAPSGS